MAASSPRRRRLLRGTGYLAVALVAYLVALWQMLPYPELGRRLESELRSAGIGAEVRGLGPAGLLGCAARTVTLFAPQQPELRWQLTDVALRLLPQRMLTGEGAAGLSAGFLGGSVEGTALWQDPPRFEAGWHGLQLGKVPLPAVAKDLPLAGRVAGDLQLAADPAQPTRADGNFAAQLQDVRIGPGKVQGIPVPEIRLGDGTFKLRIGQGKVEVESADFKNGDIEAGFTGNVLLRPNLQRSLVNGILTLRPEPQAAKDLALAFALFPGAKGSDGRYTARVRGTLGAPRLLRR